MNSCGNSFHIHSNAVFDISGIVADFFRQIYSLVT